MVEAVAALLLTGLGLMGCFFGPFPIMWMFALLLGIAQGASFTLALTVIGLRSYDSHVAAQLSSMAQELGYLIASCGPFIAGVAVACNRLAVQPGCVVRGCLRGGGVVRLCSGAAGACEGACRVSGRWTVMAHSRALACCRRYAKPPAAALSRRRIVSDGFRRFPRVVERFGHFLAVTLPNATFRPLRRCGLSCNALRHPLSAICSAKGSVALFSA